MLDVTGCTCPTGLVWRGVFDATGVQYKVPEWVVVEPEGVVEQEEEGGRVEGVDGEGVGIGKGVGDGKEEEEEEEDEVVSVCIRTSHDSRDVMLQIHRKDSVARIVGKLREKAKVCYKITFFFRIISLFLSFLVHTGRERERALVGLWID
jgi:hypothetical protein